MAEIVSELFVNEVSNTSQNSKNMDTESYEIQISGDSFSLNGDGSLQTVMPYKEVPTGTAGFQFNHEIT